MEKKLKVDPKGQRLRRIEEPGTLLAGKAIKYSTCVLGVVVMGGLLKTLFGGLTVFGMARMIASVI
jgi:hypothetical protein